MESNEGNIKNYLGNTNLKGKGSTVNFTPEMVEEYVKCYNDPIYFAEKYIQIVHVDHGLIPIQLYQYQKDIIKAYLDHRRVVVNTSRQAGKTTTATIIILHFVLFHSHKYVALTANKGDSAREILDRIKIAYEELPKWLQQGVVEWNKGSVEFDNGCKIIAASTSSSAIRGKSVALLYNDETAFVENWDEFFASVFPTISSGQQSKIILTSTPNGLNHFHKIVHGAREKENNYKLIEVHWKEVPGRDEAWKQETLAAMNFDQEKFNQEFCLEFIGTSTTLISGSSLKSLVYRRPIKEHEGLKQYEKPVKDHTYACVVDVSRGRGLDYSAFSIVDITKMPYRQVAAYRDNLITPIDYCELIYRICTMYNQAHVLVEINDIGEQIVDALHYDFEYENIIYTKNSGRLGKQISGGFSGTSDRGIRTTKSVKNVGCNILKMLVEGDQLILNDYDTIKELFSFSRKGTSYEAESGHTDDLVMGLVLFSWMSNQAFFKDLTNINTLIHLKKKTAEELEEDLLPFFYDDGSNDIMDDVAFLR